MQMKKWGYLPCPKTQQWHSRAVIQLNVPGHLCVLHRVHFPHRKRKTTKKPLSSQPRTVTLSSSSFPLRVLLLSQCSSFFFADFTLAHVSDLHSLGFLLFLPLISFSFCAISPQVNYWTTCRELH